MDAAPASNEESGGGSCAFLRSFSNAMRVVTKRGGKLPHPFQTLHIADRSAALQPCDGPAQCIVQGHRFGGDRRHCRAAMTHAPLVTHSHAETQYRISVCEQQQLDSTRPTHDMYEL
ncbi:hypothetical protein PHYPSEUDO_009802 [Phytophthora pseudosyringae]|uniref:Uncharacterized protein n=1 Tax=Phytophthora pseudosyringae TaxID=221518 RepID=A0A8T1VBE5_9STRA|nr:hypothetical protein PHYPSEUDO_009802 [Phytophthora pseudosyringae]